MKLLIFLAIVAYVAGTSLIGSNKCTWGPGYWCSRVSHAKKCGAMEHCLNIFWPKQQIRTISSPSCTACKMAIGELRFSLKNSGTQKQVADFLAQFCTILPADEKRKCKSMVTDDLTGVLQLLNSNINSEVVCAAVDICMEDENNNQQARDTTATIVATTPSQDPTTQSPEKICTDCKTLVQDIKVVMTDNQTVIEVVEKLEQVICAKMGPLQFICKQVVEMYIPQYFKNLSTLIDPDMICTALGLCQNGDPFDNYSYSRLMTAMRSVIQDVAGTSCPIYKKFATEIQNIIRYENIQAAIGKTLNEICDLLPGEEDECRAFVQTHSQTVIQTILDVDFGEISNENQLYFQADALEVNAEINGVSCQLCQLVIKYAKTLLKNNSTVQIIFDELHKICAQLPGNIASQCNSIIDNYGYQLLQYLVKNLDAKQACQIFGLCPKNAESQVAGGECELCQMVIKYAKTMLKNNSTVQIIFDELHTLCDQLPGNIASQCNSIIDNYGYQLLQYLINDVDPKQACQIFGLCPKNAESPVPKVEGVLCDECEHFLSKLKAFLLNETEDEVIDVLKSICSILPSNLKDACDQMVDTYSKTVIDYILKMDPQAICVKIRMCSSMNKTPAVPKVEGVLCDKCEDIVSKLKEFLLSNKTEDEVIAKLKSICSILPSNLKDVCDEMIDKYSKEIIDYILKMDPQTICIKILMCSSMNKTPAVSKVEGILCDECEDFVSKLKAFLLSETEDEVIDVLKSICSMLPSNLRGVCDEMVDAYSMTVIDYILDMDPRAICVKIGMCSSMNKTPAMKKSKKECVICKMVSATLEYLLHENSTSEEIKKAVDVVCYLIGSELRSECRSFVSRYEAAIISIFVAKLKPDKLCDWCNKMVISPVLKARNLKDSKCILCDYIMNELDSLVENNRSEAFIEKTLKRFCSLTSPSIKECNAFIDEYRTIIIYLLEQEIDPKRVCMKFGLCSGQRRMWKPPQPKPDVASLIFKKKSQRSKNVHMRRVSGVPVKRKRGSVMMRNIATWFGP